MYNSESFPNPKMTEDYELISSDSFENKAEYMSAKEIAQEGDYQNIKNELIEKNLLKSAMEYVTIKYKEDFSKMNFLTERDIEIFTILDLYDEELAIHSLETYYIAKEKTEKKLAHDVVLADLFEREGVSPEQFFRACFLHDIGKIEIPNFIINNEINNNEMDLLLRGLVIDDKDPVTLDKIHDIGEAEDIDNDDTLKEILKEHHLRPVHLVPVKYILSEEEQEILKKRGISLDYSLMDIIKTHEKHSEEILASYDSLEIESELVGSHHNYHGRGSKYPMTVDAIHLTVDMVELIRIADMTEALTASRSYNKQGFSLPKVLKIILEETEAGKIDPKIAYLWVEDEVRKIENQQDHLNEEDSNNFEFVKSRLNEISRNIVPADFHQKVA